VLHGVHLHLQSGEQSGFALPQVQLEQSPLQEHLINSVHDLESCGIVIQNWYPWLWYLGLCKSWGEGNTRHMRLCAGRPDVRTSWSSTSLVGGSLSIARFFSQNSSLLASL